MAAIIDNAAVILHTYTIVIGNPDANLTYTNMQYYIFTKLSKSDPDEALGVLIRYKDYKANMMDTFYRACFLFLFISIFNTYKPPPQLMQNSKNCRYTVIEGERLRPVIAGERKHNGLVKMKLCYFVKVVDNRNDIDSIFPDIVNGQIINTLASAYTVDKHFMRYHASFASYRNGDTWSPDNLHKYMFPTDSDSYRPQYSLTPVSVCISNVVNGVAVSKADADQFKKAQNALLELCNAMDIFGLEYGLLHNDLHAGNIFFDIQKECLVIIDYGRSHFQRFLDEPNDTINSLIAFEKIKHYSEKRAPRQRPLNNYEEFSSNPEYFPPNTRIMRKSTLFIRDCYPMYILDYIQLTYVFLRKSMAYRKDPTKIFSLGFGFMTFSTFGIQIDTSMDVSSIIDIYNRGYDNASEYDMCIREGMVYLTSYLQTLCVQGSSIFSCLRGSHKLNGMFPFSYLHSTIMTQGGLVLAKQDQAEKSIRDIIEKFEACSNRGADLSKLRIMNKIFPASSGGGAPKKKSGGVTLSVSPTVLIEATTSAEDAYRSMIMDRLPEKKVLESQEGGGGKSTHKYNGRVYKIRVGARGGKYILVGKAKKKVYVS